MRWPVEYIYLNIQQRQLGLKLWLGSGGAFRLQNLHGTVITGSIFRKIRKTLALTFGF